MKRYTLLTKSPIQKLSALRRDMLLWYKINGEMVQCSRSTSFTALREHIDRNRLYVELK